MERDQAEARSRNRLVIGLLVFVVLVATVLSVATYVNGRNSDIQNAKSIRRANQAIVEGRRADYRICIRQMVNRAVLDNGRAKDKDNDIVFLPLYDCAPDLYGMPIRRLTPKQATAYRMQIASIPENKLP